MCIVEPLKVFSPSPTPFWKEIVLLGVSKYPYQKVTMLSMAEMGLWKESFEDYLFKSSIKSKNSTLAITEEEVTKTLDLFTSKVLLHPSK